MLGSLHDAEEIAQESLVRGWQRLDEVRSADATRSWLYKIATNLCLDALKGRRRRALPHLLAPPATSRTAFGPPAHEGLWIEAAPDMLLDVEDDPEQRPDARVSLRESIGLAFITALQFLPPKQRAALLLVDVVGWTPRETADLLETSTVSVNSLLQRARKSVETLPAEPSRSAQRGDDDAELLRRYITTWESGDLDALTALLAEDAILSMPPQREWYAGREAIKQFLARVLAGPPRAYRLLPTRANGGHAMAVYTRPMAGGVYEPAALTLLTIRGGLFSQMVRFASPHVFPRFGLPDRLPESGFGRDAGVTPSA
jgi:RNA polymerase sigma-70 factor (ECF subfamily)